ncbi:MAG: (Fe-S)-binding protein, partial [Thaumarchaeota archaeon]|nr:(Fe-S)-binding protein [Nitrososphaerota archaeon]
MADTGAVYLVAYGGFLASLLAISYAILSQARRAGVPLGIGRILALTKDELRRLLTFDAVFLMHISIAAGVGLSIAIFVLDPVLQYLPLLKPLLLLASLPLVVGLAAAFVWRIQRFVRSKKVEKELLRVEKGVSSASTLLQVVLMLAIALTASELVIAWIAGASTYGAGLGIARNMLVAAYYAKPTVNLVSTFDRPLPSIRAPFSLADVVSGKADAAEVKSGVGKLSEFEPYEHLSFDSCVEIGACEAACPATAAGRPLSPRVLVRKLSLLSSTEGLAADPLSAVDEDELWSCTSCGACVSSCPVSVKHLDIVYDLRRELVGRSKLDREKTGMLQNLAQAQNPYGLKQSTRGDWAAGLGIPPLASNPGAEYLFWVGCVASFDQRAQGVAKAMAKILGKAGISYAILGSEEMCTGDPARRLGEEG